MEDTAAASRLLGNLLEHVAEMEPASSLAIAYAGEEAGLRHLRSAGYDVAGVAAVHPEGHVLVLGPGSTWNLPGTRALEGWLEDGGRVLATGVGANELADLLTEPAETRRAQYVAASFDPPAMGSPFAGVGPGETHLREPRELDLIAGEAAFADGLLAAYGGGVVLCQVAPWQFDYEAQFNLKMPFRRTSVLLSRLLGNMGARAPTPLPGRFAEPVAEGEARWLDGLYLDTPEEMDDPYRFFRW